MRNVGLEEAQAGIKIVGRNIRNLRYADDTSLMAESEEKLKTLLMKVKEMGISDHLTFLLRNLYAGQKASVRTGHGTTDWFQIGKGFGYRIKVVYCHPAYLANMQSTS